jgi:hypothetical protein
LRVSVTDLKSTAYTLKPPLSTETNYVTSLDAVPIYYKIGTTGTEQKYTPDCDISGSDGAKTCTVSSTDNADNTGTATITVYHRSKVVFFTPGGAGTKSGVDWQNAKDSTGLQDAMDNLAYADKEFWVGNGIYAPRLQLSYSMTLYGGFDAANKPYDLTGRSLLGTRFTGYFQATPVQTTMNFTLDRIVLKEVAISGSSNTANLKDVTLDDNGEAPTFGLYLMDNAIITATNFNVNNKFYGTNVLKLGGTFNMVGGSITGNGTTWGRAMEIAGSMTLSNGATIAGNISQEHPGKQGDVSGSLTIGSGVNFLCSSVELFAGGTCR